MTKGTMQAKKLIKRNEQETCINWFRHENDVTIYSSDTTISKKLEKRGIKPYRDTGDSKHFKIPKTWIHIHPPRKSKKVPS
jgi:hypothetical protein